MADSGVTTLPDQLAESSADKEASINHNADAASPAVLFGRRELTCTGLTWGYYGGKINVAGTVTPIANGTVALTTAATNYVEATTAGAVSANTSAYTGGRIPLYRVVTGASTVSSYTDDRVIALGGVLGGGSTPTESLIIAASDETTALTAAADKVKFRMPYAFTVSAVRASLSTAQTSGSIFTVDIHESGTTILSTKITIDNGEKTSTTAATAAVVNDSSLADDAEMTVDIDQIGDGTAKGLKVYLIGTRT
jgi:hypothetical protein